MKQITYILIGILFPMLLHAQNNELRGTTKDVSSGELLIGANVVSTKDSATSKGTVTDANGNYSIKLDDGEYSISISYVGYVSQTQKVKMEGKPVVLDFSLETKTLKAVEVTADVAIGRETPVAFTNVSAQKIEEELGNRDIPMLLNMTPGVYSTQQGGGYGDARLSIRGFNQMNIAVLIDGIPQNDMEFGQVYWYNMDGLGDVTRSIQIQRGLGASKLAIASVGGTLNILTKGVESAPAISYKQEIGNDGFYKELLTMTTGKMKNGWGITASGERKTGNGWVNETWINVWNYFLKVEKTEGKHLFSLELNGGPVKHVEHTYLSPISTFDSTYAKSIFHGDSANYINVKNTPSYGVRYNKNWGPLDRFTLNGTDTIHDKTNLASHVNFYNQPEIALRDFWTINEKMYWSNTVYYSYGTGGGTAPYATFATIPATGQENIQAVYNAQAYGPYAIDPYYSKTEHKSTNFIYAARNDHYWYGLISSLNYDFTKNLSLVAGVDLRNYDGKHYDQVYDLLGGDYIINSFDKNKSDTVVKHLGDKFAKDYESYIHWEGLYGQLEYKKKNWSAFITLTGSDISFKRVDYYLLPTDTFRSTPYKTYPGYIAKAGANFNINKYNNIFLNAGYITEAPPFANVWDANNRPVLGAENQIIKSIEMGYGLRVKRFKLNINGYYTDWLNKPLSSPDNITVGDNLYYYNVNGLEAINKGLEFEMLYDILRNVRLEGVASIANNVWNNANDTAEVKDPLNDSVVTKVAFNAKGVHVGNAAQTQVAGAIRWELVKGLFIKPQIVFYDRDYADFDPTTLNNSNVYYAAHPNHDSWEMPSFYLLSIHAGYEFRFHKFKFNFSFHINNLLNTEYIADAENNKVAPYTFDAKSAWVYMGMGRTYTTSLKVTF